MVETPYVELADGFLPPLLEWGGPINGRLIRSDWGLQVSEVGLAFRASRRSAALIWSPPLFGPACHFKQAMPSRGRRTFAQLSSVMPTSGQPPHPTPPVCCWPRTSATQGPACAPIWPLGKGGWPVGRTEELHHLQQPTLDRDILRMHLHSGGQCLEGLPRPGCGICRSYFNKAGGPRRTRLGSQCVCALG